MVPTFSDPQECRAQPGPRPTVLGIDEHFFSRRHGYATTVCDLKNHKVYDVVLGRSELSLEGYLQRLPGTRLVRAVCRDWAAVDRAVVRKHFPQARIVANRFHVIRLVNPPFLTCRRVLDPAGSKNRGFLSLLRRPRHRLTAEQHLRLSAYLARHPAWEPVYRFSNGSARCCWKSIKTGRKA